MPRAAREQRHALHVAPGAQPIFRELGIDAEAVFDHERIVPWRTLNDRENCTLDATLQDGSSVRWHIKRYAATKSRDGSGIAEAEVNGLRLLHERGIPSVDLIAWGQLGDGRSFVILDELRGFGPADKMIEAGVPFERLLEPTARLAARLHEAGLHHRDLYLCHFFARAPGESDKVELRLIDTARVRPLPAFLRNRWIIKDLAQFWYSTTKLPVSDDQRRRWLERYAQPRSIDPRPLVGKIESKVRWIARSDARTRRREPGRNISIPTSMPPSPQPSPGGRGGDVT